MRNLPFTYRLLILVFCLPACQQTSSPTLSKEIQEPVPVAAVSSASPTPCPPASYAVVRQQLQEKRRQLARQYQQAPAAARDSLLGLAMDQLVQALVGEVFPCWYGTPWTFEGHTNQPGQGSIACGYFVSTTLKHAGFNLNRYRLAQQAALPIIQSLAQETHRFKTRKACLDFVESHPGSLFVLGLSYHVGFLYAAPEGAQFFHAGYFPPQQVCKEEARTSYTLEQSQIWVVGEINQNPALARRWLSGESVPIITP